MEEESKKGRSVALLMVDFSSCHFPIKFTKASSFLLLLPHLLLHPFYQTRLVIIPPPSSHNAPRWFKCIRPEHPAMGV